MRDINSKVFENKLVRNGYSRSNESRMVNYKYLLVNRYKKRYLMTNGELNHVLKEHMEAVGKTEYGVIVYVSKEIEDNNEYKKFNSGGGEQFYTELVEHGRKRKGVK